MLSAMGFFWLSFSAVSLAFGVPDVNFWAPLIIANVCFVGSVVKK